MLNTETLIKGLESYFDPEGDFKEDILSLKEGSFFDKIKTMIELVKEAIVVVEKLALDLGGLKAGSEKKEAIVKWIDDCLELPWYAEFFDGKLAAAVIDATVLWYNKKLGNDWLKIFE